MSPFLARLVPLDQMVAVTGFVTMGVTVEAVYIKRDRSLGFMPIEHLRFESGIVPRGFFDDEGEVVEVEA